MQSDLPATDHLPPIGAPNPAPPLREPALPLPAYRYVPGRLPHPFAHPAGHGHRLTPAVLGPAWDRTRPPVMDRRFRHACDLFDQRYPWEAHELWEEIWRAAPAGAPERELLQGLILAAAALLKWHMGQADAAERLWARAGLRLGRATAALGPEPWGVRVGPLLAAGPGGWPTLG